jgi:hypothetical protein
MLVMRPINSFTIPAFLSVKTGQSALSPPRRALFSIARCRSFNRRRYGLNPAIPPAIIIMPDGDAEILSVRRRVARIDRRPQVRA